MKLIVNPHKIEIIKEPINEREINITKCEFEFADEITNDYVKEAYFTFNGATYKQIIVNNECDIPSEVLTEKGQVELGVVAFLVENEEEIKRYNPSPAYFESWVGSLKDNAENSEPITPSDKEQIEQQLLNITAEMNNLDVDAEKVEHTTTITITKKDGTQKEVQVLDGEKGDKGDKGDAGAIKMVIVNELPSTGADDTIYLVPNTDPETGNNYDEYVYVNGAWEKLGGIQVEVDLTDYVKNTDYASSDKAGVIKTKSTHATLIGTGINTGVLVCNPVSYSNYNNLDTYAFISKGTLENVITGKGLVSNTDYASSSKGGTIKVCEQYGYTVGSEYGNLYPLTKSYAEYTSISNSYFISKGTLDNVLTAKIGDIDSVLDSINNEVV